MIFWFCLIVFCLFAVGGIIWGILDRDIRVLGACFGGGISLALILAMVFGIIGFFVVEAPDSEEIAVRSVTMTEIYALEDNFFTGRAVLGGSLQYVVVVKNDDGNKLLQKYNALTVPVDDEWTGTPHVETTTLRIPKEGKYRWFWTPGPKVSHIIRIPPDSVIDGEFTIDLE